MKWINNSCPDCQEMWPRMSCATPHLLPIKSTPRRPSLVFDRRFYSETYLEGIETSGPLPLNNNACSGTTLAPKGRTRLSTIHPMPLDGWTTPLSLWISIETEHQPEGTTEGITEAITSEDGRIPTDIKGITRKTTSKAMQLLQGIHRTLASNVEK